MLTATVFNLDVPDRNGTIYDTASLMAAVAKFNENDGGFATVDSPQHYPGCVNLEKVAAKVVLVVNKRSIIAEIELLDTPYGVIASQLIAAGVVAISPVLTAQAPSSTDRAIVHSISQLVFVSISHLTPITDLTIVQNWLNNNIDANELYKLIKSDK